MQWSKYVLPKEIAAAKVLEYTPTQFSLGTPQQALNYLTEKSRGSDFRMNDTIRVQTGVEQIEKESEQEKIERAALAKLQEIQEGAYQEAYQLGMEEGKKEAFEKMSSRIAEKLEEFDNLLSSIGTLKRDLVSFNESHIMSMVFFLAARIAKKEVSDSNDGLLSVLRDAVSLSQDEENVMVRVSPEQLEFFEELQSQTGREFEFLKKLKFEASAEVSVGGCIVQTNYGEVDARLEQRIETLWTALQENMPKVKDKIAS